MPGVCVCELVLLVHGQAGNGGKGRTGSAADAGVPQELTS